MFQRIFNSSVLFTIGAVLASTAAAEPIMRAGNVCWTGEVTSSVATSKEDRAWTFKINFVFTPDGDTKQALTGECVGIGSIVAGKPELLPNFCTHILKDGATYMSRGISDAMDSQLRTYYGGTGSLKGIKGGSEGMPQIRLKAPKGKFAGCRSFKSEYTVGG